MLAVGGMAWLREVSYGFSLRGWPLRRGSVSFFECPIVSPGAAVRVAARPGWLAPRMRPATSNTRASSPPYP